jgi:SAM-dependent methyltransferase
VVGVAYVLGADDDNLDIGLLVPLFCAMLFLACVAAHAELARLRPPPRGLTGFYLLTSLGGALGGVLVALVAPAVFTREWELPLLLGVLTLLLALASGVGADSLRARHRVRWVTSALVALGVTYALRQRALTPQHPARYVARNFYGTLRVMDGEAARVLNHGTITHGEQLLDPLQRRAPITYYGPESGVGLALREAMERPTVRVGVVGLGAGTLAAYCRAGDTYRFYELNPLVVEVAEREFSYLRDCPAQVQVVLGDARLSLAREQPQGFDVLVIDAFSSDAIPVHLLTREAFALYARHLAPGGVLAVHVSNRHLHLTPVVALAARAVNLRAAEVETEDDPDESLRRYGATWVLLSARDGLFTRPPFQGAVTKPAPPAHLRLWTDDYSNLLRVVNWRQTDE